MVDKGKSYSEEVQASVTVNNDDTASKDDEFVVALKELLSTPAQEGGITTRRLFAAMQVYHENDKPKLD
ncbi:hypothetical protein N836_07290 [Leptolyngbya sp. Heron Island J]|uniref:hypothetical protein n=1 Tax=Leptolyngbya sp. Heron Island J TaxID=1385935 RepID=UPI0003B97932|nr:hypothetical protein [Leptolyngbya sp. Heron Island J]ESA36571.1 hypothetical protein N836_07290 [Leptolyngbya sp. Heron Island J]